MSGYMISREPGIARAVAMPPLGMTRRSSRPCTTSVGRLDPPEVPRPVRAGQDGHGLAGGTVEVVAACRRLLEHGPHRRSVEVGPGDQPEHLHPVLHSLRGVARQVAGRFAQQRPVHATVPAIAGVRHDRRQAGHATGMTDRQGLADHAAHRDTDDVRPLDADRLQQPGRVVGHVGQRVGGLGVALRGDGGEDLAAGRHRSVDRATTGRRHGCRNGSPGTPVDELLDERQGPLDELPAEAHHQQQRRRVVVAVDVVLDADPVRRDRRHGGRN